MAMRLRFGGSSSGTPANDSGTETGAWHTTGRARRAIVRNVDAGVLAIMLAGSALAAGNVFGDAVAAVRESVAAQEGVMEWRAEPHIVLAKAPCASPGGDNRPTLVE
jgi:hypothetical protein